MSNKFKTTLTDIERKNLFKQYKVSNLGDLNIALGNELLLELGFYSSVKQIGGNREWYLY